MGGASCAPGVGAGRLRAQWPEAQLQARRRVRAAGLRGQRARGNSLNRENGHERSERN